MTNTIDITPSPDGYRRMLEVIITTSTNKADKEWAMRELARVMKQSYQLTKE